MTYSACLVLVRLVMKRWCAGRGEIHRWRVALQAEAVHVAAYEQARVRRTVRDMTRSTTLGLDRRMLVNEWSESLDVALGADGILCCTDSKEVRLEGPVRGVAIRALQ